VAVALVAGATLRAGIPEAGDPARLLDLRWLARPQPGEFFLIDTFSDPAEAPPEHAGKFVLVDVPGPGVLQHLMSAPGAEIELEVDGEVIWRGKPGEGWPNVYVAPKPEQRGDPPWAYPMVQTAWLTSHLALPVPFVERLTVRTASAKSAIRAAGRRLPEAPGRRFGDEVYLESARQAFEVLNGPIQESFAIPGSRVVPVEAFCGAEQRAALLELEGAGEVAGMTLEVRPAAYSLLRQLVIEITPDGAGAPTLRMPFVDFLGVSHPWSHAWFFMAGDQVAGLLHPYNRGRDGQWLSRLTTFFKLPIPFASGLRIELWNRSKDLPLTLRGRVRVAPLAAAEAACAARLCGTSRRVDLPRPEGVAELLAPSAAGHLVGFSVFATGHRTLYRGDHRWRVRDRIELTDASGRRIASGPGLLPFAYAGNSPMFYGITWNQNSVYRHSMIGAGRHFWLDPTPLRPDMRFLYASGAPNGPTRAETGVLWYQPPPETGGAGLYRAPPQPADVEPVPPVRFGLQAAVEPGGWCAEAEELAVAAVSGGGDVRASTSGGMDALASGGAYLAWDADGPGAAMDLLVPTPLARYVSVWYSKVMCPAGASFNVELLPPEQTEVRPLFEKGDADFLGRVLGRAAGVCRIDCFGTWPWARKAVHRMRPMLNPNPGGVGRLRFLCVTKRGRAYLLALDQLGVTPCPAAPEGWRELEETPLARGHVDVAADLMPYGGRELYGWGGRLVEACGPGSVAFRVSCPLAGPPAAALELRLRLESGVWSVRLDDGPRIELGGDAAAKGQAQGDDKASGEPTLLTIPFARPHPRPLTAMLVVECRSGAGRLVLDAWRLTPE